MILQKQSPTIDRLTDVELEMMNIIWARGEASVSDVIDALSTERPLAYTSVSTILRILEKKKVLSARKEGRGHVYLPLISRAQYGELSLKSFVKNVFQGDHVSLVKQLVSSNGLTKEDLDDLKKLIAQSESET